ncbi:MAG: hypothetical protein LBR53_06470 [Deltaproteobacteria bacterium]|jgi:hypothetical protein|nr:hypothetical protein [Deltaproteobacteria bacterium]
MTHKPFKKNVLPNYYFISTMMLDGYEFVYRSVPPTSYTQYISGNTALNLESRHTDTLGGTDFMENFFCFPDEDVPLMLWGDVSEKFRNTLHIYGKWGIHDDYADVLRYAGFEHDFEKVYVADHYRAICDIVYADITRGGPRKLNYNKAYGPNFFSNWIVASNIIEIEKCNYLLDKIGEMSPYLPRECVPCLDNWIDFEKEAIIIGST